MIDNPKPKKEAQIIVGIAGIIISIFGLFYSQKLRGKLKVVVIGLCLLCLSFSTWLVFTGWKNYAVVMIGNTRIEEGKTYQGTPVISVKNKMALQANMIKQNKKFLWLPCAKGGKWYLPSAYFYTRWNLPNKDVVCPNGKYLVKYNG